MEFHFEEVEMALAGPLEATGLPAGVLFGVLLTFAHNGRKAMFANLADLLGRLAGDVNAENGWLRDRLAARGRLSLSAEIGPRHGEIAAGQRLKAARVAELANGLLEVGAHDVRLRARIQRFHKKDQPMLDG